MAPGVLGTWRLPDPDSVRSGPRHRHCSDDLWMEEEKRYKRKLARAARRSLGRLDDMLSPQGLDRVRCDDDDDGDDEGTQLRPSTQTMQCYGGHHQIALHFPSPSCSTCSTSTSASVHLSFPICLTAGRLSLPQIRIREYKLGKEFGFFVLCLCLLPVAFSFSPPY